MIFMIMVVKKTDFLNQIIMISKRKAVKPTLKSFVRSRGQNDHHDIIYKSEKNSKSEILLKDRYWTSNDHMGKELRALKALCQSSG